MRKVLLAAMFICSSSYAQSLVNSIPVQLKGNRDVFQISDKKNKNTAFFLSDRKKVRAYLFDEALHTKDTISTIRPERKFKDILGFSGRASNPTIYWTSNSKEEIYIQSLDFGTRKVSGISIVNKLQENNESYLGSFSENEKFYILSVKGKTSLLKLYEFNGEQVTDHAIDLSSFTFFKSNTEPASLSRILTGYLEGVDDFETSSFTNAGFGNTVESLVNKISVESPVSLTETAKKRKAYSTDNEIILTMDFSENTTQVVIINLNTYQATLKNIDKPKLQNPEKEKIKTNSFVIDHKIFQLAVLQNQMGLSLRDLEGNLIKEYTINENEEFKINNTPFTRLNHMGSERELETTSQFLRKIHRSNIGISVYKLYENYYVTLGSVSTERPSGGFGGMGMPGMGMPGIPLGSRLTFQPINYVGMNFYGYSNRRSISTDCLFDPQLNHVKGKINPLAFDKIEEMNKKETELVTETIFKIDDAFYFGYYESMIKQYSFRKFTD